MHSSICSGTVKILYILTGLLIQMHKMQESQFLNSPGRHLLHLFHPIFSLLFFPPSLPPSPFSSCTQCGGLLRPHVVWFGEPLETQVMDKVQQILAECDLCLLVRYQTLGVERNVVLELSHSPLFRMSLHILLMLNVPWYWCCTQHHIRISELSFMLIYILF